MFARRVSIREYTPRSPDFSARRHLAHFLGLGGASREQEAQIGAGRDIARAHFHKLCGKLRTGGESADADMLAVTAADVDGLGVSVAQARMLVLAGGAPGGEAVVTAD